MRACRFPVVQILVLVSPSIVVVVGIVDHNGIYSNIVLAVREIAVAVGSNAERASDGRGNDMPGRKEETKIR